MHDPILCLSTSKQSCFIKLVFNNYCNLLQTNMLLLPLLPILLHLSAASPANAARIRIDIGSNAAPALIFTLNTVKAKPGDVLDFHFIDENIVSSVLKGVATSPCTPAVGAGAFNSGLVLGDPNGVRTSLPIDLMSADICIDQYLLC